MFIKMSVLNKTKEREKQNISNYFVIITKKKNPTQTQNVYQKSFFFFFLCFCVQLNLLIWWLPFHTTIVQRENSPTCLCSYIQSSLRLRQAHLLADSIIYFFTITLKKKKYFMLKIIFFFVCFKFKVFYVLKYVF